ncbi:MAG: hypothetical protein JW841_01805 [Deltaproteobacteria bacterium]|nr:hypothetical protein [Deltaproteobacteria bacterium]
MKTVLAVYFSLAMSLLFLQACSPKKTLILTVDPFTVNGMTVSSSLKDGKLTPFATDFSFMGKVKYPESGKLIFKAIGLHSPNLRVFIDDQIVWEPQIDGFKDFEESKPIAVAQKNENDEINLRVVVRGLNGGIQSFEVYR